MYVSRHFPWGLGAGQAWFCRSALVGFVLLGCVASVAADEPSLELEISQSSVRVGDHVEVLASARGGEGWLWGELTVALEPAGPWELVDGPVAVPETRPPVWKLTLAPMELGDRVVPSIAVSVRSPDGEAVDISSDDKPTVSVVSILSGEEGDAASAPMRDPVGVRGFPWEWILPVAVVLLPLLAGVVWWWRGRGRSGTADQPMLAPLAELELVVAELEKRIGREPPAGICDGLAAGLRRYLERRTGEPAEEMTSFELRLLARRRGWPEGAQRLVQRVMELADGVRFGRRPSTDDDLRAAAGGALDTARMVETFLREAEEERVAAEAGR